VKLGGTVATVGFPNIGLQRFAPKLAKGEIVSLSGAADDARYFQISVPVQPGTNNVLPGILPADQTSLESLRVIFRQDAGSTLWTRAGQRGGRGVGQVECRRRAQDQRRVAPAAAG
jgi:hypothetical protein